MSEGISEIKSNLNLPLQKHTPIAIVVDSDADFAPLRIGDKFLASITLIKMKSIFLVKTDFGRFYFQSKLPLQKQQELEFQLVSKHNQIQLLITSVNGHSPSEKLIASLLKSDFSIKKPKLANVSQQLIGLKGKSAKNAAVKLTLGTITTATMLGNINITSSKNNTLLGNQQVKAAATSREGALLKLHPSIKTQDTFESTKFNQLSPQLTPPVKTQKNSQTLHKVETISDTNKSLVRGPTTQYKVKITSVTLPELLSINGGLPVKKEISLAIGKSVTGVVIGKQSPSNSIIQTHFGPIAVRTPHILQPGTTISLEVLSPSPKSKDVASNTLTQKAGSIIQETRCWNSLNDAIRTLSYENLSVASQAVSSGILKFDNTFTANILFFISAIRGMDIRSLLGDAPIRTLQRLRPNLLSQLNNEFKQIGRLYDEPSTNEWRTILIPVVVGDKIEQIQLFMRRKKMDATRAHDTIRFVIDINLSKIGKLQLDGFVSPENKQFDLIIRAHNSLNDNQKKHIDMIFVQANEISGVAGMLKFQDNPTNFLNINEDNISGDGWMV